MRLAAVERAAGVLGGESRGARRAVEDRGGEFLAGEGLAVVGVADGGGAVVGVDVVSPCT